LHPVESSDDLRGLNQRAVAEQPRRQVAGLSPAAFEAHHHARFGERPRALEVTLLQPRRGLRQYALYFLMYAPRIAAVACDVTPEQAGIGVILRAARDRIGEPLLLAQLLEEARRRSRAHHVGEHLRGIGIGRGPFGRGHGDRDMRLRALAASEATPAGEVCRGLLW